MKSYTFKSALTVLSLLFCFSQVLGQEDDVVIDIKPIGGSDKKQTAQKTESQEEEAVPFAIIEEVPVYPGCETYQSNLDRRKCMSQNMNALIAANFDVTDKSLPAGKYRIMVTFKIDDSGYVRDIQARAPNELLENEAKRVAGLLPRMKPGTQRGQNVTVAYSLPIVFATQ